MKPVVTSSESVRLPAISVRLPVPLIARINERWRREKQRESGVRKVSRNEVIARLIDAGLIAGEQSMQESK